jgi:NAD(P)-dependent dehydrogenase (short-subunit alcohol dehydrogenase family)
MELQLDGKVALVTGASKGIGKSIAAAMSGAGAKVMLTSRKKDGLDAAAAEMPGEVDVFPANAGEADQAEACIAATIERFGAVDVLVNNAATNPYIGPIMGLPLGAAEKTVKVNQTAVLVWTQRAWAAWMRDHGGSVINISSVGGLGVSANTAWYAVTKAAVLHLTRQLAAELAPGVRVNAIAPGLVKTDMARALWEPNEAAIAAGTPLGRLGVPDDIGAAALFLASDAASWITGQTLVIDGGSTIRAGRGEGS